MSKDDDGHTPPSDSQRDKPDKPDKEKRDDDRSGYDPMPDDEPEPGEND